MAGDLDFGFRVGRGTFDVRFTTLNARLRSMTPGSIDAEGEKIVAAEFRRLRKLVEETLKAYAPVGPEPITVQFANGTSKTFFEGPHLRDTIEARVVRNVLEARMAWWGFVTTEGRGALPDRGRDENGRRKTYPVWVPGRGLEFHPIVGPATTHSDGGLSARERMDWLKRANNELFNGGVVEVTATIIAERIADMLALSGSGYDSLTSRKLARPAQGMRAKQKALVKRQKSQARYRARRRRLGPGATTPRRIKAEATRRKKLSTRPELEAEDVRGGVYRLTAKATRRAHGLHRPARRYGTLLRQMMRERRQYFSRLMEELPEPNYNVFED